MNRSTKPGKATAPPGRSRGRESVAERKKRAVRIAERLADAYPRARCSLDFSGPFQLVIATILSAQCTDKRVNMVTPALFRRWPSPEAMAGATQPQLEELARQLKKRCGCGGTVRNGAIEIQGDHRDLLVAELTRLGWAAKRSGG